MYSTILPYQLICRFLIFIPLSVSPLVSFYTLRYVMLCRDVAGSDDSCDVLMGGTTADAYGCSVLLLLLPHVQVPATVRVR